METVQELGLVIHDLVNGNSAHIDEYLNIYQDLFPQYIHYAPIMRQRAEEVQDKFHNERWHQWFLTMDEQPVGIAGFFYNRTRNVGALMDFAIRPEARRIVYNNQGLAHRVLQFAIEQLGRDAQTEGQKDPLFMVAEVEYAPLLKKYVEYGYLQFPIEYYEPVYDDQLADIAYGLKNLDKIGSRSMHLGAFQIPGHRFDPMNVRTIRLALDTMLIDHYGLPVEHWLVKKILLTIPK